MDWPVPPTGKENGRFFSSYCSAGGGHQILALPMWLPMYLDHFLPLLTDNQTALLLTIMAYYTSFLIFYVSHHFQAALHWSSQFTIKMETATDWKLQHKPSCKTSFLNRERKPHSPWCSFLIFLYELSELICSLAKYKSFCLFVFLYFRINVHRIFSFAFFVIFSWRWRQDLK